MSYIVTGNDLTEEVGCRFLLTDTSNVPSNPVKIAGIYSNVPYPPSCTECSVPIPAGYVATIVYNNTIIATYTNPTNLCRQLVVSYSKSTGIPDGNYTFNFYDPTANLIGTKVLSVGGMDYTGYAIMGLAVVGIVVIGNEIYKGMK